MSAIKHYAGAKVKVKMKSTRTTLQHQHKTSLVHVQSIAEKHTPIFSRALCARKRKRQLLPEEGASLEHAR